MKLDSLQALLMDELSDIYDAESQLTKALPKMAKAAHSAELREAFETHLQETMTQIDRLKKIFEQLDQKPKSKTCKAMKGLVAEGDEMAKESGDPAVLDAGLIGAAQRVEHYEIAAYGCARTFAELLGLDSAAEMLQTTLDEEANTDERLNEIAKNIINPEASQASEGATDGKGKNKSRPWS